MNGIQRHKIPEKYLKYLERFCRKNVPEVKFYSTYVVDSPMIHKTDTGYEVFLLRCVFLDASNGVLIGLRNNKVFICQKHFSKSGRFNYLTLIRKFNVESLVNNHNQVFPKHRVYDATSKQALSYAKKLESKVRDIYHAQSVAFCKKLKADKLAKKKAKGKK